MQLTTHTYQHESETMDGTNLFVGNLRHPLREAVRATVMNQFPTTLRPLVNPVRSAIKTVHAITTGKYTIKLPCDKSHWDSLKHNVASFNCELGIHQWSSGYNNNVESCVFTNVRSFFKFLNFGDAFYTNVLGRAMIDRDGNPCFVLLVSCPSNDSSIDDVTLLVGRSWNGRAEGSDLSGVVLQDVVTTPIFRVKNINSVEISTALRQKWRVDDVVIRNHSDKLVYDGFACSWKRTQGKNGYISIHIPCVIFRSQWKFDLLSELSNSVSSVVPSA